MTYSIAEVVKEQKEEALRIARKAGCKGRVYHVADSRGLYWQCEVDGRPYNFSVGRRRG